MIVFKTICFAHIIELKALICNSNLFHRTISMYSHITKCIPIKMYSIHSYFILRFYDLQQI